VEPSGIFAQRALYRGTGGEMNQEQANREYRGQVDKRAGQMIEACVELERHRSLWTAHALLAGGGDAEELVEIFDKQLDQGLYWGAGAPLGSTEGGHLDAWRPRSGPFQIFPSIVLAHRWGEKIPAAARERLRRFFVQGAHERGNTENHWLMYYTGNLLAAELYADEPIFWNGLPPAAMRDEASRWILGTIERTARLGHHEYDSTGYHVEHVVPYMALADHAADPHMRRQAENQLTLLVADMALEYFHGTWAGGHSREGYRQNTWNKVGPVQGLHYLFFGDEEFEPLRHCQGFTVPAYTSDYRPPALLAEMALDRSEAYAVKKTKAPRSIYRHAEHKADPVRKYTYMSRSFALGSTQVGLPGTQAGPIDLVSWDMSWDSDELHTKIVCNHPYRGAERFSAFLCDLPQRIGRSVPGDKPYLQFPDRLFGASPYERLMQHEGTLVALYRIPADDESPYLNLFLPEQLAWHEQDGWLFAAGNGFYVGVRPIGPYRWLDIRESNNANIMVRQGDLINGWLLRLDGLTPGLVLEAVEADEAGDFADYCRRRTALPLDLNGWPVDGQVALESAGGARLEMQYDGPHKVDGEAIDYSAYPLYGAPGVEAPLGTGKVSFKKGDLEHEVDFGVDPDAPLAPMRVIG
jgi:hypothetical protein